MVLLTRLVMPDQAAAKSVRDNALVAGRVAALKAICEMRVDRDDLRGVVDAAAAGPGRKKKADRGPDPPTLEDFRCPRHPRFCCVAASPCRPQTLADCTDCSF